MELVLFCAALCAFFAGGPSAALLMRCALNACQRFSPRASLALAALCALCGALTQLLARGGLRAVPGPRALIASQAFAGGVIGRALLLILVARFPDSLTLAGVQALPLLAVFLCALLPGRPRSGSLALALSLPAAALGGFLGAGESAVLSLVLPAGLHAGRQSAGALLLTVCAQTGALLLTLLCGAAEVFPSRLLTALMLGAALGALAAEQCRERGALHRGMRAALLTYGFFAALACAEQAFA